MRETTVHYELSEEQEKRLIQIQAAYQSHGIEMLEEELFEFIMTTGCVSDIDSRFGMHEEIIQQWKEKVKDESNIRNGL